MNKHKWTHSQICVTNASDVLQVVSKALNDTFMRLLAQAQMFMR